MEANILRFYQSVLEPIVDVCAKHALELLSSCHKRNSDIDRHTSIIASGIDFALGHYLSSQLVGRRIFDR